MDFLDIAQPEALKAHLRRLADTSPAASSPDSAGVFSPSSRGSYTFQALARLDHYLARRHSVLGQALSQHLEEFANFIGVISQLDQQHAADFQKVRR